MEWERKAGSCLPFSFQSRRYSLSCGVSQTEEGEDLMGRGRQREPIDSREQDACNERKQKEQTHVVAHWIQLSLHGPRTRSLLPLK